MATEWNLFFTRLVSRWSTASLQVQNSDTRQISVFESNPLYGSVSTGPFV
jgi:hypothetical protein